MPAGIGGIPRSLNFASDRLSCTSSRSPCRTWISTAVWLSANVVNVSLPLAVIVGGIRPSAYQHFDLLARDPFSHRFRFFALREIPFRPDHRLADFLDVFEGRPGPSCPPEAARYVRRGGEGAVDQELIDVVAA